MKKYLLLCLLSFGAQAAEFCLGEREQIPYVGKTLWSTDCLGKDIWVSGGTSTKALASFASKLGTAGLKNVGLFYDDYLMVISTHSLAEQRLKQICLSSPASSRKSTETLLCNNGLRLTFTNSTLQTLENYASENGFRVLERFDVGYGKQILIGK